MEIAEAGCFIVQTSDLHGDGDRGNLTVTGILVDMKLVLRVPVLTETDVGLSDGTKLKYAGFSQCDFH